MTKSERIDLRVSPEQLALLDGITLIGETRTDVLLRGVRTVVLLRDDEHLDALIEAAVRRAPQRMSWTPRTDEVDAQLGSPPRVRRAPARPGRVPGGGGRPLSGRAVRIGQAGGPLGPTGLAARARLAPGPVRAWMLGSKPRYLYSEAAAIREALAAVAQS